MLLATGCANRSDIAPAITPSRTLMPTQKISIDGTMVSVQTAASPAEQQLGLSGIQYLRANEGMLFPYSPPAKPTFWMKGMLFPIDIIWIQDGRVIGIEPNLQPPSIEQADNTLTRYLAPGNVTAVLEVQAGWAAAHAVHAGDTVLMVPN